MNERYVEIKCLLWLDIAALYDRAGLSADATKARIAAARYTLDPAIKMAQQGYYQEALPRFDKGQEILEETSLWGDGWAEIYLIRAICYARLGRKRKAMKALKKAQELGPDNETVREIGARLELAKAA